jgi:hypothetical protein
MSSNDFEFNEWYPPEEWPDDAEVKKRVTAEKEVDPEEYDLEIPGPMTCPECGIERERTKEIERHGECGKCLNVVSAFSKEEIENFNSE